MATAVVARGLDIKDVKHADNQKMPTEMDGVKIKDRLNCTCGEPKSCYFNPTFSSAGWSKDQGSVELVVWRTKVGLLQPEGRGFFLVQVTQEPSFLMPHLTPHQDRLKNLKRRQREKEGGNC